MLRTAIFAVIASCLLLARGAQSAEKNIIFIIADDLSPTLGCYGDPIAVSPQIDALAKDGTRFVNAFATTANATCAPHAVPSTT